MTHSAATHSYTFFIYLGSIITPCLIFLFFVFGLCFTGFFITLCFVTTKRVRGLLKERFSKRLNGANKPRAGTTHDKRTAITDVERPGGSSIITREQERMNSS